MADSNDIGPQKPRRIAAGAYHNIVCSNVKLDHTAHGDHDIVGTEETAWAFGSNRNHQLGWFWPSERDEEKTTFAKPEHSKGTTEEEKDKFSREQMALFSDSPKELRFDGRGMFEASCGGNHTVLLHKKGEQAGGQVYVMGLGTNGRLGIPRPKSLDDLGKLLNEEGNCWLPKHPRDYAEQLSKSYCEYVSKLIDHNQYSKWVIRDPVRVTFPMEQKVARIACGIDHTLAIVQTGAVYAWGLGSYGNLGTGSTEDEFEPKRVQMPDSTIAIQIAAGMKHSMALTNSGIMYSWGHGGNGRLGQGPEMKASLSPKIIEAMQGAPTLPTMRWIAASETHSASIDVLGNVFSWGAGSYGRTGHGQEDIDEPTPKQMSSLDGNPCKEVALGVVHSIALTKKGTVFGWGSGSATGLIGPDSKTVIAPPAKIRSNPTWADGDQEMQAIIEIACGAFHSLALSDKGDLFGWGKDLEGRLGGICKLEATEAHFPTKMKNGNREFKAWNTKDMMQFQKCQAELEGEDEIDGGKKEDKLEITADNEDQPREVHCGETHSMCITNKGEVWLWGCNQYGQIGNGETNDAYIAVMLPLDRKQVVKQIAFGVEHCLLCLELVGEGSENVLSWGRNTRGQLGRPTKESPDDDSGTATRPKAVGEVRDCIRVAAGEDHSAAILVSGDLYTWGSVENGKLGHDGSAAPGGFHLYPAAVRGLGQLKQVSCGAQHTAVVDQRGKLYTWGAGWFGRLGHGDMSNQAAPKLVEWFAKRGTAGRDDVRVKAPDVKKIHCATYCSLITTKDKSLWMVGRENCVCENEHTATPLLFDHCKEPNGTDIQVQQVSTGVAHTFLLTCLGNIYVWGDNFKGQLGLLTKDRYDKESFQLQHIQTPVILKNPIIESKGKKVICIATGKSHAVACLDGGDLYSWGLSNSGRLGHAQEPDRQNPIRKANKVHSKWQDTALISSADVGMGGDQQDPQEAMEVIEELQNGEKEDTKDDDEKGGRQEKELFLAMQQNIREEKKEYKARSLMSEEAKMLQTYQGFIDHIFHLWDPPVGKDAETIEKMRQKGDTIELEWYLRRLQSKMDMSLCRNLDRLDLTYDYPSLDKLTIYPEVTPRLLYYEELLWILQQQPCYLAKVCRYEFFNPTQGFVRYDAKGDTNVTFRPQILTKIVSSLFAELSNDRIRHLLMALIRRIVKQEIKDFFKKGKRPEELYNPKESTTVLLIRYFVKHRVFKKDSHTRVVGLEFRESLLHLIEHWTVNSGKKKKGGRGDASHDRGEEDTLFAMTVEELQEHEPLEGAHETGKNSSRQQSERAEHLRNRLVEHQRVFARFLGFKEDKKVVEDVPQDAASSVGGDTASSMGDDSPKTFEEYLENFMLEDEIKAILRCIYEELEYCCQNKTELLSEEDRKPILTKTVYEPIARVVMTAVLGEMMEQHQGFMSAGEEVQMKKGWKDQIMKRGALVDDKGIDKRLDAMAKRMHFNISSIGKFMKLAAFGEFSAQQAEVRYLGKQLCSYMLKYTRKFLEDARDNTETNLTIDLYTSHYDLNDHFVAFNTTDLLELSNVLWLFKDKIMLLDRPEDDRLYKLLMQIQPPKPPPTEEQAGAKGKKAEHKKHVAVIALTANQEDVTKDGDLVVNVKSADGGRYDGYELPRGPQKANEDLEETAVRVFKEKTGAKISADAEMRLLIHREMESGDQLAIFALKDQVSVQQTTGDTEKNTDGSDKPSVKALHLADPKWRNELSDQLEKWAVITYMAWFEKRLPWDQIPVELKMQDIAEIKKRLWAPWQMRIVSDTNVQHNFMPNHRFLEKQKDLCFCRECQAPIPRTLSPQNQRGRSDLRLIKVFRAKEGPKIENRYPFLELEVLLGDENLEDLRRNDFLMVKYDLEEQQKVLTQTMNQKGGDASKSASTFALIAQIDDAKKNIDILRTAGFSESRLKDFVSDALRYRKDHSAYLQSVLRGAADIETAREAYANKLRGLINAMKFAVECSEEGSIPAVIKTKASDQGVTLTMAGVEKQMKAKKRESSEDQPLMYPSQTVSVGFLRGKKVVARLGDAKTKSELKSIYFTFSLMESGDWNVKATHKEGPRDDGHVIMAFDITVEQLEDMKRAGKTAKMPYQNGFVVFNCFSLVQLLSRIASHSG